jgi:SsrA-binding protein
MSIVQNRKAFHDYFIEAQLQAGLVLEGWEVKAIRERRVQLQEAYVRYIKGAFWLIGCHMTPLHSASTHIKADPVRSRKLLLNQKEAHKWIGKVEQAGYTIIPLNLHYQKGWIKLEIALAKGKKQFDKRQSEKERQWKQDKQRLLRESLKG